MFSILANELEAIRKGMRSYVLLKGEVLIRQLEIHLCDPLIGQKTFLLILDVTFGTLDYFSHAKEVVNDYGFAHPYELVDYLKRNISGKLNLKDKWTCVKVRSVEWPNDIKAVDAAIFKLRFLTNMNGSRSQN